MKKNLLFKMAPSLYLLFLMQAFTPANAQTNPTAQSLPYTQNFGTSTFTSMPTGMAAWTPTGGNRTTQAAAQSAAPNGNASVTAATASQTGGNVYGYATGGNARVYIQQSSNATNGTNTIAMAINTGNTTSITISYQLEMINGGVATQDYGLELQYRLGTSGSWTNVPGSAITFGAVTSYTTTTLSYTVTGLTANSNYQIRWITWRPDGTGASKGIGIDNIAVAAAAVNPVFNAFNNQTKTYGDANFTMTASSNNTTGAITYTSSATGVATINSTTGSVAIKGFGTTTITASQAASTGFNAGSTTATLTVNKAAGLTITANGISKTYGTVLSNGPSGNFTVSGLQYSDHLGSGATLTNTYGSGAAATDSATLGSVSPAVYAGSIVPSSLVNGTGATYNPNNYGSPTYVNGDITVNKANQSIAFAITDAKQYGSADYLPDAASATSAVNPISYSTGNPSVADIISGHIRIVATGTAVITAAQAGNDNYNPAAALQTLVVTPKSLSIEGIVANNKPFDGNTAATLSGTAFLSGVVGSDDVALAGVPTAAFISASVGENIPVNVTGYALEGASAGNYSLSAPTLFADIIATTPTIFSNGTLSAVNTVYGSATAIPANFTVSGQSLLDGILVTPPAGFEVSLLEGSGYSPTVTVGGSGNLSATAVYVRLSASALAGTYSGNILLSSMDAVSVPVPVAASTVSAKELTVSGLTGVDKIYDGNTAASIAGTAALSGRVGTDDVFLDDSSATFNFDTATAGTNKTVIASGFAIAGTAAGNYTLSQPAGITATIHKAASTISVTGSASFTYNNAPQGPNTANVNGSSGTVTYLYTGVDPVVAATAVRPANAGSYTVRATVAADANHESATSLEYPFVIGKASQTITLAATDIRTTATTTYNLAPNASSGLPVFYNTLDASVITISGNTVTIIGAGNATIIASQAGNANYNAAPQMTQILTVTQPDCISNSGNVSWNFAGVSPSATQPNVTVGALAQGNNNGTTTLIDDTSASSGYAGASGTNNAGAAARTGALNTNAGGSAYFSFTVTPASGYNFTLAGISFGVRSTGTGPQAYALRSSADNYATNIVSGTIATGSWLLKSHSSLAFTGQGNGTPITFRLYGFNGSGSPGANTANWRIDDLVLNLTVSNTPSEATAGADQLVCGLSSNALGGNTPLLGTGTWTQVSGPGTTNFSLAGSGVSTATASVFGTYVYRWTIANGCATTQSDDVTVTFSNPGTNTTTITACDSYTWPVNNVTYTTSGTRTVANGCATEILDLTIVPSTVALDTVAACDSFTWTAGNGSTYSESGNYNHITGCHTQTLALTITPATSHNTVISACDGYTWTAGSGSTYTEGGTYTHTEGCHTETLSLTVTPGTANTMNVSACDSYTWAAGNGVTYTQSGNYVYTNNCHTENLALIINTNSIITQPANAQVCRSAGASVVYSVVAGAADTTYQWYFQPASENPVSGVWSAIFDDDNYSGASSAVLTVTKSEPALPETGTKYRIVITSACGSVTSDIASLTDILLPATPSTLVLTNENAVPPATTTTPVTAVAIYVGTDTEFKLTAAPVSNVLYKWTLPLGMTSDSTNSTTGLTITTENFIHVKFSASSSNTPLIPYVQTINAQGCMSDPKATVPLTRLLPTAPVLTMNNGLTTTPVTSFAPYMGTETVLRLSATSAVSATSYVWELPPGVNRLTALSGGTITTETSSNEPYIFINFAGVTNANTYSYTATNGLLTHVLRLGVKSKNGVGVSITNNGTLANPATASTAKLLTLTAIAPYPPATLALNDGSSTTPVTLISKLVGEQGTYRLSAAASPLARSYEWELPQGITRMTAPEGGISTDSTTSTDPFIYVKFTGNVAAPFMQFGVKAVNGIGSSVNNNSALAPSTASTAKLLRLTTSVPVAPVTLAINNGVNTTPITIVSKLVGQQGTYRLSAATSALANAYAWELPAGVTRMTALEGGEPTDSTTSIEPFIFIKFTDNVTAPYMQFGVKAVNGVGQSLSNNTALNPATASTAKLLRLNTTAPLAPVNIVLTEPESTVAVTVISKYIGKPNILKLTAAASALANIYLWELPAGVNRTDENGQTITEITSAEPFIYVTFTDFTVSGPASVSLVLGVKAVNGVGASVTVNPAPNAASTAKLLKLTAGVANVVAAVNGAVSVCDRTEGYEYLFAAPVGANYYVITAPAGAVITSASNPDNASNTLLTTDLNFKVVYGATVFSPTDRSLTIRSGNAFGLTANARILLLTKTACPDSGKLSVPSAAMRAVAYPNPYVDTFSLDAASGNQAGILVKVYDLTGKLIESRLLDTAAPVQLGSGYPSGVYNVILTQDDNVTSLRVVKR